MKSLLVLIVAAVLVVGCGNPDGALIQAAVDGNIEAVKKHIAAGMYVNAKDDGDRTPLHWTAGEGHKEVVELLIANGADVNAKNNGGSTPLDWAIEWKRTEIAELLRHHGGKTGEELKAEGK